MGRPDFDRPTVTVFASERDGGDYEAPIPAPILRQRAQIKRWLYAVDKLAAKRGLTREQAAAWLAAR